MNNIVTNTQIAQFQIQASLLLVQSVELSDFDKEQGRKRNPDGTWAKSPQSIKKVVKYKIDDFELQKIMNNVINNNIGEHLDGLSGLIKEKINYLIHESDFAKKCNSFFQELVTSIGENAKRGFHEARSVLKKIRNSKFADAISQIKNKILSSDPMIYAGLVAGFGVFVSICGIATFGAGVAAIGSAMASNAGTAEIVLALSKITSGALWSVIGGLIIVPLAGQIVIAKAVSPEVDLPKKEEDLHKNKKKEKKINLTIDASKEMVVLKNAGIPKEIAREIISGKYPSVSTLFEKLKDLSEKQVNLFRKIESISRDIYLHESDVLDAERKKISDELRKELGLG